MKKKNRKREIKQIKRLQILSSAVVFCLILLLFMTYLELNIILVVFIAAVITQTFYMFTKLLVTFLDSFK